MKASSCMCRWAVASVALVGLLLIPAPGYSATAKVGAVISFTTWGNGNPELSYSFTGFHTGTFTSYLPAEALLPTTFQGALLKNNRGLVFCNGASNVKNANFLCFTSATSPCPLAEARWNARSRMAASTPPLGKVFSELSGPLFANCPTIEPPGCNGVVRATKILAVDLETGRVIEPGWRLEAPGGLTRNAVVDGKPYFLEEWALLDTLDPSTTMTLAASSEQATTQVGTWTTSLVGSPGFRPGGRYLVIEAARHIDNRVEPLVRLESLRAGESRQVQLPDGRVVFKASFSAAGELEGVQVVDGSQRAAAILAEDLRVEFPRLPGASEHDDHRSIVFATFDVVDGRPHFVAAVPLLPQCCCTGSWCI